MKGGHVQVELLDADERELDLILEATIGRGELDAQVLDIGLVEAHRDDELLHEGRVGAGGLDLLQVRLHAAVRVRVAALRRTARLDESVVELGRDEADDLVQCVGVDGLVLVERAEDLAVLAAVAARGEQACGEEGDDGREKRLEVEATLGLHLNEVLTSTFVEAEGRPGLVDDGVHHGVEDRDAHVRHDRTLAVELRVEVGLQLRLRLEAAIAAAAGEH